MDVTRSTRVALGFVVLAMAGLSADSNWPQFRGLQAGVAADDPALPDTWGPTENIIWKIDVPGRAWSSPIVWGDHVFVTTVVNTAGAEEPLKPTSAYVGRRSFGGPMTGDDVATPSVPHRWVLYDIDFKTGRIRWERALQTSVPPSRHQKNSYASETPVTDGERVYVYSGYVGLFAFEMNGTPVWSKPMDHLKTRGWGSAASPVLYKDRMYIVNDNEEQSFIAAYHKLTGEQVWRISRDEGSNWSTPFAWENELRTEIITTGTRGVRSYGLDGRLLWHLSGMSSFHVQTPFSRHGLLYINSGYPADPTRPVYAIRRGASGDISLKDGAATNDYIVWSHPTLGSYHPSALVYGDYYYTLLDRGILICHDGKTGKEVYPRQRITAGTLFTASPWAYNGKIFALSEDGDTFVIQAGPEFKVLGKNSLGEMTLATPAVANGSLIVRTASKLYRIGRTTGG